MTTITGHVTARADCVAAMANMDKAAGELAEAIRTEYSIGRDIRVLNGGREGYVVGHPRAREGLVIVRTGNLEQQLYAADIAVIEKGAE